MLKKFALKGKSSLKLFYKPIIRRRRSKKKQLYTMYAKLHSTLPVKDDLILYESSYGRGMICNPYAIFKAMMQDELFEQFQHVWVLEDLTEHQDLIQAYQDMPNVSFVERDTEAYLAYLVTAKYLINNTSFSSYFAKKKGQIYINTWHSITVKKLGFDIPNGKIASGNMVRNLLAADYIMSANRFTTQIFKEAYKLEGLYEGRIIENGYPRNDLVLQTPRPAMLQRLTAAGVAVDETKKIILYAPTWRGENYFKPEDSISDYLQVLTTLTQQINSAEYQVLVKPHPAVYKHLAEAKSMTAFIPAHLDTNELLSVVDILISDYSSIYFDFMLTQRPILFYIPDILQYQENRGVYFSLAELPGPATKDLADISRWINEIDEVKRQYQDIYTTTKAWACEHDDGQVASKMVDILFKHNLQPYHVLPPLRTTKKKLLLYAGALKTNGVTFSLLSLLQRLDYNKFDVSLIVPKPKEQDVTENVAKIPAQVRVLARTAAYNATLTEDIRYQFVRTFGIGTPLLKKLFPQQLFAREFQRCFGDSRFDYIVDFSGYGPFFNYLMMQAQDAKRIIWQHNDLLRDKDRMVAGQEKAYRERQTGIRAVFSLYEHYDKIVSCGKAIMEVNRKNLATSKTDHKFTYATNTTDFQRIITGLQQEASLELDGMPYLIQARVSDRSGMIQGDIIKLPIPTNINFVTMGRLSPEKNQQNLIKAFARVYQENPHCRLYIVGEGDLRPTLEKLIARLKLKTVVFLPGNLDNPFIVLKACHCFVFPSHFEGQGLAVLEARMVGLPILVADFPAARDVCVDDGQMVIRQDEQSIYLGLTAFLAGQVPADYHFDPEAYNRRCYEEFEQLFK
ncbi:MAG: CDP-glycerol glycerophosphotransferase family protein [Firmicutes bacterium]|nr:CDP-glycerol glycerophosphotransferase family protein [Bacillota bacterium]